MERISRMRDPTTFERSLGTHIMLDQTGRSSRRSMRALMAGSLTASALLFGTVASAAAQGGTNPPPAQPNPTIRPLQTIAPLPPIGPSAPSGPQQILPPPGGAPVPGGP